MQPGLPPNVVQVHMQPGMAPPHVGIDHGAALQHIMNVLNSLDIRQQVDASNIHNLQAVVSQLHANQPAIAHHAANMAAQATTSSNVQSVQTAAQAITISKEVMKHLQPAKFSGRKGINFEDFEFKVQKYFDALKIDDATSLAMLPLLLDGEALVWWRVTVEQELPHNRPQTYRDAMALMRNKFMDKLQSRKARDDLAKARQATSVTEFIKTIDRLCLKIPDITDAEKLDRLIRGLKPEVYKHMIVSRERHTYKEACLLAEELDYAIMQGRRQLPAPRPPRREPADSHDMELNSLNPNRFAPNRREQLGQRNNSQRQDKPRLSDEERDKLMKEGRCFICKEKGHRSSECRKKPKAPNGTQGRHK
jgi:hypothetical protein